MKKHRFILLLLSFVLLLGMGDTLSMEAKTVSAKGRTTASKKSASKVMSFQIPGTKTTCTLMSNGTVAPLKKDRGSWKKRDGVIFVEVDLIKPGTESDIYAGFIVGDRFYYDFFGSEGCWEERYDPSTKTVYWCEYSCKLSQLKSVKVTKY